jgi:signal transduction histidine kinase
MAQSERILVVDDAPTVRQLLKLMLEDAGYGVELAATAGEAMAAISDRRYDLLLVDKNLDGDDGFAVCRAGRDLQPDAARILITADDSLESAIQAVDEDIFAYLRKPLRKQQVLLRVRRALDRVRLTREREEARAETQAAKEALEKRSQELERTLERLLKTQHRLVESEKLVSVGMLAAGVAHEINNPACFILPNLEYLKRGARNLAELARSAPAGEEKIAAELQHVDRMVERCLEGLKRIQRVVGTLQLFSRRQVNAPVPVNLNALCVSLLDLVSHELRGRAELDVDLKPIPAVLGQEKELADAVLNLLLNARRSVFASKEEGVSHRIRLTTELREGQEVALTVVDTGPALVTGLGPIADAFFFEGEADQGPGLTLSLVREILDRHGGRLELVSDTEGNHLTATLPAAPVAAVQG